MVEISHDPRALLRALAEPFGLDVMETAAMFDQKPAFDLLPLAQALSRYCVLLRDADDVVTGVIAALQFRATRSLEDVN